MNPVNTGSFGAAAGGLSPELQAAVQRRSGAGGGATAQVSQGAPTFDPTTQPATPPTPPSAGGGAASPQPQPQQPLSSPLPFDPAEVKMIVGALTSRLKALSQMGGA